jgi:hypothetical protein
MATNGRVGGLRVDPAVQDWQRSAATNRAALTKKQRKDRARVRVKYDMPPELKERIEAAAEHERTSASQFAAFLLIWAMEQYEDQGSQTGAALRDLVFEAKELSRSLRFEWNLKLD